MKKEKIYSTELHLASEAKFYKKKVLIDAIAFGKALLPYYVPKEVSITCNVKHKCRKTCCLKELETLSVSTTSANFVKLIGVSDTHNKAVIKEMFSIPYECSVSINVKEVYTVEEVFLSPVVDILKQDRASSSTHRLGYYIGHGLETNVPYELECTNVSEPQHNKVVHIISKAEKLKTSIDSFTLSEEAHEKFKIFNPVAKTPESVFEKLSEIYDIYASNVTKIYNRLDLHMAIDLVFHSPLSFYFGNEYVHKGWGDVMIIGDTRCGKGYVSEGLSKYYNVGEFVSGENLSFAGLIGGAQQLNSRWAITWGKIPLNDRQLVIVDEASEIDPKAFSRLSRVRSEGVAEIIKIQSERTTARTRLIFLANPPGRTISTYSFGIQSIQDVVANPEDISRFDYVLIVANNEVMLEDINKKHSEVNNPYAGLDRDLVLWCWSRKAKQVKFTTAAQQLILDLAIKLGKLYDQSIPLIQGENIRIKLAKIAAMIAARVYSCSSNGDSLFIDTYHVEAAYAFINMIYKKSCSSYYFYSQIKKQSSSIEHKDKIDRYIASFEAKYEIIDYFLNNNYITLTDLSEHINQPKEIVREIISTLLKYKCLQKKFSFYVKNQSFVDWLKSYVS